MVKYKDNKISMSLKEHIQKTDLLNKTTKTELLDNFDKFNDEQKRKIKESLDENNIKKELLQEILNLNMMMDQEITEVKILRIDEGKYKKEFNEHLTTIKEFISAGFSIEKTMIKELETVSNKLFDLLSEMEKKGMDINYNELLNVISDQNIPQEIKDIFQKILNK